MNLSVVALRDITESHLLEVIESTENMYLIGAHLRPQKISFNKSTYELLVKEFRWAAPDIPGGPSGLLITSVHGMDVEVDDSVPDGKMRFEAFIEVKA